MRCLFSDRSDPGPDRDEPPDLDKSPDLDESLDLDELYRVPALAPGQAHVRSNFVSSLDGAAELDGTSGALGGEADRLVFSTLRQLCDVVLVGAGTVRSENYGGVVVPAGRRDRRVAAGLAPVPPVAVVSASLGLDPAARLFTAEVPPIVLTCAAAPAERKAALRKAAEVEECGDERVDPSLALARLVELGLPRVLTEGGPRLHAQLIAAGLLDELCLTLAPVLAGPGRAGVTAGDRWTTPTGFQLGHVLTDGDYLFLRYRSADQG